MQSWYLMKSPTLTSGDESEIYNSFKEDALDELLDNDIAYTVKVYNYDLSEYTETRAIVNNRTQDTDLKTLTRNMLFPIGTAVAGNYVEYQDRMWLITGFVDNNGIYEKAIMYLCNYLLTWVNDSGQIIQRWVNAASASQYNHGETTQTYYEVRTDQLMILAPDDDETLLIKTGQRFIIDKRCEIFEKDISSSTNVSTGYDLSVYRTTRLDSVLYNFVGNGYFQFMVYQDEIRENDGFYRFNNTGYWLCDGDQVDTTTVSQTKHMEILPVDGDMILDGDYTEYFAKFYNASGTEVTGTPTWSITSTFSDRITITPDATNQKVSLKVSNVKGMRNKTFTLNLSADGYTTVTKTITLREFV